MTTSIQTKPMKNLLICLLLFITLVSSTPVDCETKALTVLSVETFNAIDCSKLPICTIQCTEPCNKLIHFNVAGTSLAPFYEATCNTPKSKRIADYIFNFVKQTNQVAQLYIKVAKNNQNNDLTLEDEDDILEFEEESSTLIWEGATQKDADRQIAKVESAVKIQDAFRAFGNEIKRLCDLKELGQTPVDVLNQLWPKYRPETVTTEGANNVESQKNALIGEVAKIYSENCNCGLLTSQVSKDAQTEFSKSFTNVCKSQCAPKVPKQPITPKTAKRPSQNYK